MSREPGIPAGYPKWNHIFRDLFFGGRIENKHRVISDFFSFFFRCQRQKTAWRCMISPKYRSGIVSCDGSAEFQRQMAQNRIFQWIVYYATRKESMLFSPKVIFTRGEIDFFPVQHTRIHPFSHDSVEKAAFVCVQWRVRNLLFLINWRTIILKIMVQYYFDKNTWSP